MILGHYRSVVQERLETELDCGYGLVVERVLAKDEIGVRFPVSAQK